MKGEEVAPNKTSPKTEHLSPEMKELYKKYPLVMKDNIYGCKAFQAMPHKGIDVDPAVTSSIKCVMMH